MSYDNGLNMKDIGTCAFFNWDSSHDDSITDITGIKEKFNDLDTPFYILKTPDGIAFSSVANVCMSSHESDTKCLGIIPCVSPQSLGSEAFKKTYNLKYSYMAGSMANELSSSDMVIALGKEGFLCSFGAGGISPKKIEEAILKIKKELPNGPYCFNLIHTPYEPMMEKAAIDLYLKHNINVVEASAFITLTPSIVYYRVKGLEKAGDEILIKNKVIAKISRAEIARKFMKPAPKRILKKLIAEGLITEAQAELAGAVPMADDITVEADSGGHTDNRPMVATFNVIKSLRDQIQKEYNYKDLIRVGTGGGIGTPHAAIAAYTLGADYIVTGSVNQACKEAGTCDEVRDLLSKATITEVAMGPAADMFERGVKVQVLKKGTLYAVRAQKLYDLYTRYNSIEEIPENEKEKLEKEYFLKTCNDVWADTLKFFNERAPEQIETAEEDPKKKMALIFRWYLGLSPYWAKKGDPNHKKDYQIWCGPSMGAFNEWVKGSYLEDPENRYVASVAHQIMKGTAYLCRVNMLKYLGIDYSSEYEKYVPMK